jgi:hypothetical protein
MESPVEVKFLYLVSKLRFTCGGVYVEVSELGCPSWGQVEC